MNDLPHAGWWTGATVAAVLSLTLTSVLTGFAWSVAQTGEGTADRVTFVLLVLSAGATARWFWGRMADLMADLMGALGSLRVARKEPR